MGLGGIRLLSHTALLPGGGEGGMQCGRVPQQYWYTPQIAVITIQEGEFRQPHHRPSFLPGQFLLSHMHAARRQRRLSSSDLRAVHHHKGCAGDKQMRLYF
uniref:Uncharacterized protein n=1 Tax=Eutreptiella gymnastica TaxID=73025 RepID=A0A7S4C767_9EUGL